MHWRIVYKMVGESFQQLYEILNARSDKEIKNMYLCSYNASHKEMKWTDRLFQLYWTFLEA